MTSRFVVDESSLRIDALPPEARGNAIATLIDQIERLHPEHGVCYDEDLTNSPLYLGRTFWELFDPELELGIDHDHLERAAVAFATMQRWYDIDGPQPEDFEIQVDGGVREVSASIAWAHANASLGLDCVACVTASSLRDPGCHDILSNGVSSSVYFVQDNLDEEKYFRWIVARHAEDPDDIAHFASFAFRNLAFVQGCFDGIKSMSKPCKKLAPVIVEHLSAFSDEGERIFLGEQTRVAAEFGSLGVNVSDENGNTKGDREAMRQRIRKYEGQDYYFLWHSKIERDRDRIHVCPDLIREGGKLIVGIFCFHLK